MNEERSILLFIKTANRFAVSQFQNFLCTMYLKLDYEFSTLRSNKCLCKTQYLKIQILALDEFMWLMN